MKSYKIHIFPKHIECTQNDRRPPTPKKFSHRFFTEKMGFESIMVTSPFFDVSRFVFQKSPAQTAKWTFSQDYYKKRINPPEQSPKTGVVTFESTESSILGDQISNEIFSARKSFKLVR